LVARPVARAGTVPVFTDRRWTKEEPGCTPAASPRLRRRLSPWPPAPAVVTSSGVAHPRVGQARTAPSPDPPGSSWWDILGGFTHRFLAYSFSSCSPGPPPSDGAGHAPALSGPLATLTGTSRIGLPSASPAYCDRSAVAVSRPHSNNQRLTAHAAISAGAILGGQAHGQGADAGQLHRHRRIMPRRPQWLPPRRPHRGHGFADRAVVSAPDHPAALGT